jgi:segregation and condensation protein A
LTDQPPGEPGHEAHVAADPYGVRLGVFEGPLDLLLYLIRKNEVDIYDIPVATITNQYLVFLRTGVHLLDLEQSADFVLMAATLMKVKSQMLLPRDIEGEEGLEDEFGDPREELVRRLLEYQQFKDIAGWLGDQGKEQRDIFQRSGHLDERDVEAGLHPVSLFDLLKVYKHVIDHVPSTIAHEIIEEGVSVEECVHRILAELDSRSRVRFHELIDGHSRMSMVATFIGVLELLKSQRIRVQQARPFDDIWIEGRAEEDRTLPAAMDDTDDADDADDAEVTDDGAAFDDDGVAGAEGVGNEESVADSSSADARQTLARPWANAESEAEQEADDDQDTRRWGGTNGQEEENRS